MLPAVQQESVIPQVIETTDLGHAGKAPHWSHLANCSSASATGTEDQKGVKLLRTGKKLCPGC